jgi:hypothetical protein
MIERFLKILNPINIVLRQLKLGHLWKEEYCEIVRDILHCLKPVRLAVEALSNHDANILTSEGIFKFLFSNLEKQNSVLRSMLLKEIGNELLKHIKYLSKVNCLYEGKKDDIFALANKNERARLARPLMERLLKGKCALI